MQQLTTKEIKVYKNYIFEQIAKKFKEIGSLDLDYLKNLTNVEYEVSDVTNLIYPSIKFNDSFEKLETLSKIELNDKPNNLFDEYKIETIKIPTFSIYSKNKVVLNPYDHITDFPDYIQKCLDNIKPYMYKLDFKYDDFTILTNGEQKEFEFIDEDRNSKKYLLPIDYKTNRSTKLYEHYRDTKNQIRNIVDTIKPIDTEKLHNLIIEHYKNL